MMSLQAIKNSETSLHTGLVVFDKSTGEPITTLPIDSEDSVVVAAKRARKAQTSWSALPLSERIRLLKLARKEFMKDKELILKSLEKETGKPRFDIVGEMFSVCQQIGYYSSKSKKWLKTRKVGTFPLFGKKGLIFYKPYGLVGVISPWNAPLNLALGDVLPALFAGNAVLVKPSEITPLAVRQTVNAFNRVLPPGVLECLIGAGTTGSALVDQVDMVAVTGSCQTGKRVMEQASRKLTPVLLELGGKDPMIVLSDADLDRATSAAAWGSCFMTGQVCMSIERIYVERAISEDFKRLLKEKIAKIRTGMECPPDERDIGPFIGPNQINIVESQIADAVEKGAVIELGGSRVKSADGVYYFKPTLISNVNHDMKIMSEETFGPIACVMDVDDVDEAIHLANDSEYGLNASVWTSNIERGIAIAQKLESGNACVNDAILNAAVQSLPFGGIKQSGVGSRHGGEEGLRAFCYRQSIMIERRKRAREASWFPYEVKATRQMESVMSWLYGGRLFSILNRKTDS